MSPVPFAGLLRSVIGQWRRVVLGLATMGAVMTMGLAAVLWPPPPRAVTFPDGKRFALTIVDDTDLTTVNRARPIYKALAEAGLRTTKTVWALPAIENPGPGDQGDTLQDAPYREFILDLQAKGFEIALHGVRGGSSPRATSIEGLEEFKRIIGDYPKLFVNHSLNREDLYWGQHRLTFTPYRWLFGIARGTQFAGHIEGSPYFWADIAKQRIKYVRRFVFSDINVLHVNPATPYHLDETPYVNYWFDSSDGGSIDQFEALLSPENLDRLEREGGACIIYAHLGAGSFNSNGDANPRFLKRIREVAARPGWFVPASELLDYMSAQPGWNPRQTFRERIRLETAYLLDWLM